jgi:hypothetical protein
MLDSYPLHPDIGSDTLYLIVSTGALMYLDATHTHNRKHRQQRQVGQRLVRAGRALLALPVWLLRRFLALPSVRRVQPQALPPRRRKSRVASRRWSERLLHGGGPGWGCSPLQERGWHRGTIHVPYMYRTAGNHFTSLSLYLPLYLHCIQTWGQIHMYLTVSTDPIHCI